MGLGRSVLQSLEGTGIFAIIGIIIFFTLFIILMIRIFKMKKEKVDEYKNLPLEDDDETGESNNKSEQ
jgi:cytochrome c oxidase cbb3-type subunit IV